MNRRAQALMYSLWVLAILTVLTVSLGHRVSLGLRISSFQVNKLRSYCLANENLQKAILEVRKERGYDSLNDPWSTGIDPLTGKPLFENTVVTDEEGKININSAPADLLSRIISENAPVTNAVEVADNICAWRGDPDIGDKDYQNLGYACKGGKFSNIYELLLVKQMTPEIFAGISPWITAYPAAEAFKININTAPKKTLELLINVISQRLSTRTPKIESDPEGLLARILELRQSPAGPFSDTEIDTKLAEAAELTQPQMNIINDGLDGLKKNISVSSGTFSVISEGKIPGSKVTSRIHCVLARESGKILYWHQN